MRWWFGLSTKLIVLGAVVLSIDTLAVASPSSELLLPAETELYVSATDLGRLLDGFDDSSLGRFWNSPELARFAKHVRHHPQLLWTQAERSAGTTFGELREVTSGEACLATVKLAEGRFAHIFLFQVEGNQAQAQELIGRAGKRLLDRGAKLSRRNVAATTTYVCRLSSANAETKQTIYFLKDGVLGICADAELAKLILARWPGTPDGSLSRLTAYRDIMDRCQARAGQVKPDLRWFCNPLQVAEWMRRPDPDLEDETDTSGYAKRHGFDAIRGLGGLMKFSTEGCDLKHWTSIHAPGPYTSSMQAMAFPPGNDFAPAAWIPDDASSHMTLYIDLKNAFQHCSRLFDDLYAQGVEGTFAGLLDDLRAQDGPQVDVENHLVAHLQDRVDLIGVYIPPVSVISDGNVVVIRTKNESKVADAIDRLYRDDPGAKRFDREGPLKGLWRVGKGGPQLISCGVIVTRGCLMIASNHESIVKLLAPQAGTHQLADNTAFQRISGELAQFGQEGASLQAFSFLDRDLLTSYELLRLEQTEDAESLYVRLILGLFSAAAGSEEAKVEFTRLPQFDTVKHYLGASGMIGRSHEKGWLLEGVIVPPSEENN